MRGGGRSGSPVGENLVARRFADHYSGRSTLNLLGCTSLPVELEAINIMAAQRDLLAR